MKKRGFTLIEMLIVIIIIGVLAATLIPRIGNARARANDTARIADVKAIATALIRYSMDNITFPAIINRDDPNINKDLDVLKGEMYGLSTIPTDPVNSDDYKYYYLDTDEGKHFIVCAKMSEGSSAGNAAFNLASIEDFRNKLGSDPNYNRAISELNQGKAWHCYVG